MPKIRINEYDMTGVIQKSPISNIIYIPIPTDNAVPLITETGKVVSICYSRNELKNRIESHLVKKTELPSTEGTPSESDVTETKESIELAKASFTQAEIRGMDSRANNIGKVQSFTSDEILKEFGYEKE